MAGTSDKITFNNTDDVQMQIGVQNVYGSVYGATIGAKKKRRFSEVDDRLTDYDDDIVRSLSFPQMLDRRNNVRQPHSNTCEWIWKQTEFVQWLGRSQGLLWIMGKAGAGKSTLMAYLYESFRKTRDETKGIHLEYFFSSRGVDLQKCALGMLRSLLSQLFTRSDKVRRCVRTHYHERYAALHRDHQGRPWQQPELEGLLRNAIVQAAEEQVTIFIDALDETGETFAREIITYLYDINDHIASLSLPVKVCVSSRPYPNVAKISAFRVQVDECNADAIAAYINDRLDLDSLLTERNPDREKWQSVRETMIHQSNGLFQWARLVVSLVQDKICNGETPAAVHKWLFKTPPELDTTYTHILQQVLQRSCCEQSLVLFRWVVFSKVPMSVTDMRYALAAYQAQPGYRGRYEDLDGFVNSDETMVKLIQSWSGGLIEICPSEVGRSKYDHSVIPGGRRGLQTVHKSVNDFLLNKGFLMLSSGTDSRLQRTHSDTPKLLQKKVILEAYRALYWICLLYIAHERVLFAVWSYPLPTLKIRSPFILHATGMLLEYARMAHEEDVNNVTEEVHLLQEIFGVWIFIVKQLDNTWGNANLYIHYTHDPNLLYIACAANIDQIFNHLQHQPGIEKMSDENGMEAMHVAAVYGAMKSGATLRRAGAGLSTMTRSGDTPLSLAAAHQKEEFVDWLISEGAIVDANLPALQAALCPAAGTGNLHLVQLLLDRGANVNILGKDRWGRVASALHFAAAKGHAYMVRYLLEKGAIVEASTLDLVHVAQSICLGNEAKPLATIMRILRVLLDAGADVNAGGTDSEAAVGSSNVVAQAVTGTDSEARSIHMHLKMRGFEGHSWLTPLGTAVVTGYTDLAQLLLRYGADVNRLGPIGINDLKVDMIRLLIRAGVNFVQLCGRWEDAFRKAAASGLIELLEMLLENETDPKIVEQACDDALLSARALNNQEVAQFLLARGANINYNELSPELETPLSRAVRSDNTELVRYLLSEGASLSFCDREGNTLLHLAAKSSRSESMVDWLCTLGVPIEVQNLWGRTPLHYAISGGKRETARTLLKNGASPNTRDIYGDSPFDYARSQGDDDLMRVIKNGNYTVEESSEHVRSLILQRSIVSISTQLINNSKVRWVPGPEELGCCLLYLGEHDDAWQVLKDGFVYLHDGFLNFEACDVCGLLDTTASRYICTVCHTNTCQICFSFLKCKENSFGRCFDHEFLVVPAPTLSDFNLEDVTTMPPTLDDMRGRITEKTDRLLNTLIDRYSRAQ